MSSPSLTLQLTRADLRQIHRDHRQLRALLKELERAKDGWERYRLREEFDEDSVKMMSAPHVQKVVGHAIRLHQ